MKTQSTKHSTTHYFNLMEKMLKKYEEEIKRKNKQSNQNPCK